MDIGELAGLIAAARGRFDEAMTAATAYEEALHPRAPGGVWKRKARAQLRQVRQTHYREISAIEDTIHRRAREQTPLIPKFNQLGASWAAADAARIPGRQAAREQYAVPIDDAAYEVEVARGELAGVEAGLAEARAEEARLQALIDDPNTSEYDRYYAEQGLWNATQYVGEMEQQEYQYQEELRAAQQRHANQRARWTAVQAGWASADAKRVEDRKRIATQLRYRIRGLTENIAYNRQMYRSIWGAPISNAEWRRRQREAAARREAASSGAGEDWWLTGGTGD